MAIRNKIGRVVDRIGTRLKLPELGLSEALSGGSTENTFRPAGTDVAGAYGGPTVAQTELSRGAVGGNVPNPNIPLWQQYGYRSEADYLRDNGANSSGAGNVSTNSFGGGATGGAGGGESQIIFFGGQPYDVGDPNQLQAFYNARNAAINQMSTRDYNAFADQTRQSQGEADTQYAQSLQGIGNDLNTLKQNFTDYNTGYERNVGDTNQQYDVGTVNRGNAFAAYSPNAYQSAQGTSQQYAQGQRDLALGDLSTAKDRTYQNFNQQEAGLNQEKGNLSDQYNAFKTNSSKALQDYQDYLSDFYGGQRDQLQTEIAGSGGGTNSNAFNYVRNNPGAPLQTVNADLSAYTPYLNFNQLQGSPNANYFSTFQPTITGQNKQSPLDQYLGYSTQKKQPAYT